MGTRLFKAIQWIGVAVLITAGILWINQVGIEQIRSRIEHFGIWAPAALIGLRVLSVVIPVIPGTIYSVLAGGLFGFLPGLAIVAIADLLACTFNFYIAKRYGRDLVERFVGQPFMEKVDRLGQQYLERNFFLTTGFLMTGLFDFVCYAVGLTQMKWRSFLPALLLSIVIAKPPLVALGAGALEGGKTLLGFALVGMFGLAIVTGWLNRK